jgi:two-component system, cell cycle sensor histidine kinase and response regulator CckA
VTDLVMPGMGGKELAERVRETYPDSKVLFISGYTERFVASDNLLDLGVDFLAKPFMPDAMATKIRELLDRA